MRRRTIYSGRIVNLGLEQARLPDGTVIELEVVRHPGGAVVVAVDDSRRVCLLRQYRHAAGGWLWELPAGKLDLGEPPLATAKRELEEEAGLQAGSWTELATVVTSPGVCDEVLHLFLAQDLTSMSPRHEAHEVIEVHWLPLSEAVRRASTGEIRDAKTVVALYRAHDRLSG